MRKTFTLIAVAAASFALPLTASAQNGYGNNSLAGGVVGAVVGGVLGSNLAGTGVQDEGTAIGAVAGALIGSRLASNNSGYYRNNNTYYSGQTYGQPYGQTYYNSGYNSGYYAPSYQPVYQQPIYRPVYSTPRYYSTQPVISLNFGSSNYGRSYYQPRYNSRATTRVVYSNSRSNYNNNRGRNNRH